MSFLTKERRTEARTSPASLADQAAEVRWNYPELYRYLVNRDRQLRSLLERQPSPADIELSAVGNPATSHGRLAARLGPGIGDLADERLGTG